MPPSRLKLSGLESVAELLRKLDEASSLQGSTPQLQGSGINLA